MAQGVVLKALSGFYYVDDGARLVTCRARGKFRYAKLTPLVGDQVCFTPLEGESGALDEILPRKNEFQRPAVANVDQMIVVVSQATPTTDPFLIDRVITVAERRNCSSVICINKCDLESGERLYEIYSKAGFPTVCVSAETGDGMQALREIIAGKVSVFTGNSGVGKSSILNALEPGIALQTGQISEKLGRGRHTTRHVELHRLSGGAVVADTPGFSSFDAEGMDLCRKEELECCFREFLPYLDHCQFTGCSHIKEKGCAVLAALERGDIQPTRHASYVRLYEQAKQIPDWAR